MITLARYHMLSIILLVSPLSLLTGARKGNTDKISSRSGALQSGEHVLHPTSYTYPRERDKLAFTSYILFRTACITHETSSSLLQSLPFVTTGQSKSED